MRLPSPPKDKPHESPIRATRGTPYRISQEELDILQSRSRPARTEPHLTIGSATRKLERFHAQPRGATEEAAMQRLAGLRHAHRFGKDVVFKVFNDIDAVFFAGRLYRNVYLCWGDCAEGVAGATAPPRPWPGCPRVRIRLDRTHMELPTTRLRDVWSVLMHEMVHAYLVVLCEEYHDVDEPDPGHGRHFRRCLAAVQKGLGGKEFVELDVTHTLTDRDRLDPRWESGYRAARQTRSGRRRSGFRGVFGRRRHS